MTLRVAAASSSRIPDVANIPEGAARENRRVNRREKAKGNDAESRRRFKSHFDNAIQYLRTEINKRSRRITRSGSILWVDDNPHKHRYETDQLDQNGYDVVLVKSTREAEHHLSGSKQKPMLIISDMGRVENKAYNPTAGLDLLAKVTGSADFENRMVILNVWATWCVGCRQEHGFLMQLSRSGEVPLFGLNWRDNRPEAQRFLQQLGDPFVDSAFDQDGRVGIDWGVYGAPETFLIGADGTVLFKQLGPMSPAIWEENFVPLIEAVRENR